MQLTSMDPVQDEPENELRQWSDSDSDSGNQSDDGSEVDVDLRHWFGNSERIFRKPFWKDLVPSSAEDLAQSTQCTSDYVRAMLPHVSARPVRNVLEWNLLVMEVTQLHPREVAAVLTLMCDGQLRESFSHVASLHEMAAFMSQSRSARNAAQTEHPTRAASVLSNIPYNTYLSARGRSDDVSHRRPLLEFLLQFRYSWSAYMNVDALAAHKKTFRPASSAEQPASDSIAAQLDISIPCELVLDIVRFVGAHNLETIWECSECNPYWYDWYCHQCQLPCRYEYWSSIRHFGYCGLNCGCCRSEREGTGCGACEDLLKLKGTCLTMWALVKTYSGT